MQSLLKKVSSIQAKTDVIIAFLFIGIVNVIIFLFTGAYTGPIAASDTIVDQTEQAETISKLTDEVVLKTEVDKDILKLMKKAGVTGLSYAIINNSKIVHSKGLGFRDNNTEIENNNQTIFSAASFSKTVFAYIVMLLEEDGVIDLDKPLEEYLGKDLALIPNYGDLKGEKASSLITARTVLNHSTGFPNWRFLMDDGKLKIMFKPGTKFSYSGEGIILLQLVIEKLTNMGLEALAQQLVFEPLKMKRTSFIWQESFESNHALPHDQYERVKKFSRRNKADAAGSMQTTPEDYARFLLSILNATGKRKETINTMLNSQIAINSKAMFGPKAWQHTDAHKSMALAWGLGWGRFDSEHGRAFFHTGHDFGWQNYTVSFFEKGTALVMMSNSENFESIAREITAITIGDKYSQFDWLGYPNFDPSKQRIAPPEPVAILLSPELLTKYTGEYAFLGNRSLFIKLENNQLVNSEDRKIWTKMYAETKSLFFMEDEDTKILFIMDSENNTVGFKLLVQGMEIEGTKSN
ncbi:MAG: beta-lactamase family protein [Gammaproteobacteria bacterium]|nr:beta-lactamase family protein [Gammaproteobacteria bacterium]